MKRAFTLIELLVVVAILAIMANLGYSAYKQVQQRRTGSVAHEPVGPPSRPSMPQTVGESWRFYAADGVLAAEISQVLSNAGYQLQSLDSNSVNITRK